MDSNRPIPAEASPERIRSNRWLIAAISATVVSTALLVGAFMGLHRYPEAASDASPAPEILESGTPLVVAVARTPGGPTEWTNWSRVIKYISEAIDRPVSVRYLSREDEAVAEITRADVDIAFVCAHHYLDLRDGGHVIGVATPLVAGQSTTRLMLVTRADDTIEDFAALEGQPVAASDKSSLGGYAYLHYVCQEHSVEISDYFSELRLGDTQEANMHDLLDGEIRATVINEAQTADWDLTQFKTIEQSPPTGCPPVVVDANMDPDLVESIRQALLDFDADAELPPESHIDGFVALDDADYAFAEELRDICGHHTHP